MKQLLTVLKFEFLNIAKKKAFLITTIGAALIIGIVLSLPMFGFFNNDKTDKAPSPSSKEKSVIAVLDNSSKETLEFLSSKVPEYKFIPINLDMNKLKSEIKNEKYYAGLVIEGEDKVKVIVNNVGMMDRLGFTITDALNEKYKISQLEKHNISKKDGEKILNASINLETVQTGKNQVDSFMYTYVIIFALYMAIILYGQLVATSVASEKSSRAMEMLITSAKPRNLIFGKVIGSGLAGLLQLGVILGSGFVFYNINKEFWKDNGIVKSIFDMPSKVLILGLLFFLLGYFIYAFIYGALGSLATRTEDINTSTMPVTILFIVVFFIVISAMTSGELDSTKMVIASYVPFTSPMAMFARATMGNVSPIEISISIGILIVSTILIGYLAAMIYKKGVIMYGKTVKFKDMIKMIKR